MNDDEEVMWAKLNGDWNNANYRHKLATEGKCLVTLMKDENIPVKTAAIQYTIRQALIQIKARNGQR